VEWGTIAGMITAAATLVTAIGGLLLAVKVIMPSKDQIEEVHKIVNQQRTDMRRYIAVLERAVAEGGLDMPEDQSKLD
jgi:hypothetical protein